MGKILDTITILFKGDTSDLAKKKKEAESTSESVNKNLKDTKASTDAVNTSLNQTVKNLDNVETTSGSIGLSIAGWGYELASAVASFTPALEEPGKAIDNTTEKLKTTRRGAVELEDSLKRVASQFYNAAFGAFTVAGAVGLVANAIKNDIGNNISLAVNSRNLGVNSQDVKALGQAAKKYGSNPNDVLTALANLESRGYSPERALKQLNFLANSGAGKEGNTQNRNFLIGQGIPFNLATAFQSPNFLKQASQFRNEIPGEETEKTLTDLQEAWSNLTTQLDKTTIALTVKLIPAITGFLDLISGTTIDRLQPQYASEKEGDRIKRQSLEAYTAIKNLFVPKIDAGFNPNTFGTRNFAFHIDAINVNAPNATDSKEIAGGISFDIKSELDFILANHNDSILSR